MSKITDTSKTRNDEWLFGRNPGAIEAQESRGQQELVASSQMPRAMFGKTEPEVVEIYEQMGITGIVPTPGDDLFFNVVLPEGWEVRETDHSMHSDLFDAEGKRRGGIFYKAAFYDRRASFNMVEDE